MKRLISKLPPHKALIAFEAVVRLGTVTAAAKELTSTQPAVSQHLKNLEANLNTQLFKRIGRLLHPTEAAVKYYHSIEPLLSSMALASEQLRRAESNANLVNIVSNCGLAHFWLLPMIPDLQAKFPQLTINVMLSDSADYHSDDSLLLSFGKLADSATKHTLFAEQVCAVSSAEYAADHNLSIGSSPAQVAQHSLIHMDESDSRWLNWRNWLQYCDLQLAENKNLVLLGNYHSVISAVQQGQGVALGWLCLMQHLLESGKLVQVSNTVVSREGYGYFIDTGGASSANELLVVDYLKAAAAKNLANLPNN
ncbi:hypothetical protein A9R01_05875 ['Osedax' symbiont bacterium Rs2_46_30_T18]|nr:hypothetical protein A9R01_05875 ['Osedax' symbiont bacterium Rs2_46_30_T18]